MSSPDSLNDWLPPYGLPFRAGDQYATDRAVISGMVSNNACGMHSLIWGSTRDHLVSCKAILADGSDAVFEALSPEAFHAKCNMPTLEGRIYADLYRRLCDPATRREDRSRLSQAVAHPPQQRLRGRPAAALERVYARWAGLQPVQAGVRVGGHAVPGH
ncbi:MAG: FAD-binding protein [Betaproteobacteria bacterium]|nr:FAD-binding protein [Betaproteobacteria bacterium]